MKTITTIRYITLVILGIIIGLALNIAVSCADNGGVDIQKAVDNGGLIIDRY